MLAAVFGYMCWTVAYDTQYAMADREDDLKIGVKSTAILFGKHDVLIISLLQGVFLLSLGSRITMNEFIKTKNIYHILSIFRRR